MHKIIPHLWFDKEAKEAADFYTTVFDSAKITHASKIENTPSGDTEIVSFEIEDQPFMAISAGPVFKINPSISFLVNFDPSKHSDAKERLDNVWEKLLPGSKVLMPLQEYPFSKHYGWIEDKFGVSWQLMLSNPNGEPRPFITPSLLFTQDMNGKAKEALEYYANVFNGSTIGAEAPYPLESGRTGLMYADVHLLDSWIALMDGGTDHKFSFNEGVSLLVPCDTQEEVDYYWEKLSAVPEAEQCGWLKDKFGVSWQIHPTVMNKMMSEGTPEQVDRVTEAFLKMKKFDIAALEKVFNGK